MGKFVASRKKLLKLLTQEALSVLTPDDFDIFSGRSGRLSYDGGTVAFTVGATLTATGSGHTATIYAIVGTVASGVLLLNDADGVFLDNDVLADDGSTPGAAVADGGLGAHSGNWTGITVIEQATFTSISTGEGVKQYVDDPTFPALFDFIADIRAIQLLTGKIMAHKIDET